mmetsp:Transcript_3958/g.24935  ORF Transcript_3958/g.24935 Transcript_3958/m.24935 type:complete len:288 (+) Transcript_3958:272-1135(+)
MANVVIPRTFCGRHNPSTEAWEKAIHRAKSYPYARPSGSFLFENGKVVDVNASELLQLADARSLVPVLAVGSNASPVQLGRKFAKLSVVNIPVVTCTLRDFDVGYAPLITSYGSVPATLIPSMGTNVKAAVTYLSGELLEAMHATEGAYDLRELREVSLVLDGGRQETAILAYVHQLGSLKLPYSSIEPSNRFCNVGPVALSEIEAEGRKFPSLGQLRIQHCVRQMLQEKGLANTALSIEEFILENVTDNSVRCVRAAALGYEAQPFLHEESEILMSIGDINSRNVE